MILSYLILIPALLLLCVVLWNALAWPKLCASMSVAGTRHASVSILIPARDEELNLAACLESALVQCELVLEVLVYDDHSMDSTASIIAEYARRDERVICLKPTPLPAGWCGKNYACAQLGQAARGEWLFFLDADVRLSQDAVARMLSETERRELTLLSCWPRLDQRSFWEKALMPMLNFVVFTLYPAPLSLKRMDASLGLAHGACLLVRRETYLANGGHAAVREQIFEDVRLARLWRELGGRGLCLDGQGAVSVRMYRSFAEIWSGFQKNFFPAFSRAGSFWAFMLLHLLVFLVPFALAPLVGMRAAAWPIWLTLGCVLMMRVALALRFKQSCWSILLHPLSEILLLALGLSSWWRCRSGQGVEWKGRHYRTSTEQKV